MYSAISSLATHFSIISPNIVNRVNNLIETKINNSGWHDTLSNAYGNVPLPFRTQELLAHYNFEGLWNHTSGFRMWQWHNYSISTNNAFNQGLITEDNILNIYNQYEYYHNIAAEAVITHSDALIWFQTSLQAINA